MKKKTDDEPLRNAKPSQRPHDPQCSCMDCVNARLDAQIKRRWP